jgi:hypothetical protein
VNANISSTAKAHFIRGAIYVLLLLAAFVISLALRQQSSSNFAIDPTKGNRMASGGRQFNSAPTDFRQSGYGAST